MESNLAPVYQCRVSEPLINTFNNLKRDLGPTRSNMYQLGKAIKEVAFNHSNKICSLWGSTVLILVWNAY